jgi:hypothetical protein
MKFHLLLAGAAALAFCAGAASAATSSTGGKFAAPSQPIAYSKLDAYLKATPRQRAKGDWTNDQTAAAAQTGTPANASATAPQSDMTAPAAPATPAAQPAAAPADASPAPAAPATPPAATPPAAAPQDTTSPPPATPN